MHSPVGIFFMVSLVRCVVNQETLAEMDGSLSQQAGGLLSSLPFSGYHSVSDPQENQISFSTHKMPLVPFYVQSKSPGESFLFLYMLSKMFKSKEKGQDPDNAQRTERLNHVHIIGNSCPRRQRQ